ncbi:MAG: hypothetical protein EOO08_06990 [Chitinophagaceae bacterium]|nr:MAG: hypothetical protein EOO08_06990 [Chitinophagaceae bacterium]
MLGMIAKKLVRSDFSRNTAVIMLGTVFAQFLLIGATPWLSRLYAPEAFGLYGVFVGAATLLGYVMTLRYTNAIMLADGTELAWSVVRLCAKLTAAVAALCLVLTFVAAAPLQRWLHLEGIGRGFWLLPVYGAILGLNESLFCWLNRNKAYRQIALNRIVTSCLTLATTVLWGYFRDRSAHGLIAGSLLGQGLGTLLLFSLGRRFVSGSASAPGTQRLLVRQYKSFALYTLPSDLINILTNQLPVFLLNGLMKNPAAAGHYSMTNRVLGAPLVFVSSSISEVFRQRAADDYRQHGTCRPIFLKTTALLAVLGIVPFALIFLFGPQLFSWALGAEWEQAGRYARVLAPLFCLKFIVSPMTVTFFIAEKQRSDFYLHIAMLLLTALPFYIIHYYWGNASYALIGYSLSYSLIYLPYFYLSLRYTHNPLQGPPATAEPSPVDDGPKALML